MSNTNEMLQLIAHLPVDANSDLFRYGIEVIELDALECIEITPIPDEEAAPVSTEGCVVDHLDMEVVTYDVPVGANWMEIIRQNQKEERHGQVLC